MTELSRRNFIQRTAAVGAGVLLIGSVDALQATPASAAPGSPLGYGPLVADPAKRLALPAGFRYSIAGPEDIVCQHPGAGDHVRDHRPVAPPALSALGREWQWSL